MNPRKERQEQIRAAAKYNAACKDPVSFEAGAKWADYNPDWKEGYPQVEENKYGLPKLYLPVFDSHRQQMDQHKLPYHLPQSEGLHVRDI